MLSFYITGFKKLLNIGKKIFLVLMVYLVVVSLFLHFIAKDKPKITSDPVKKNREEIYKMINDPQLNKTEEGKLAIAVYRAILCGMIGEACTDNPADGDKNFSHSLFGFMSNLIVLPYANPPASGVYWAYSGLQNAGFVPKTYAAEGIGFAAIKPLMSVWKVFRDIAYMLLVLILITIGFMIMFRAKINPQTVVSVENSLPKIVIALLLITFSFPIAGFLIDLMYVVILLVITILSTVNIGDLSPERASSLFMELSQGDFFNLWENVFSNFDFIKVGSNLLKILGTTFSNFIRWTFGLILSIYVAASLHSKTTEKLADTLSDEGGAAVTFGIQIGKLISKPLGLFIYIILTLLLSPLILPFIIGLLVALTIVFLIFRIFFILLSTYIQIILMIVFSPLFLTLEAIPGKNIFSTWFKNLLVNILIFPLVITIILLGHLITSLFNESVLWIPPFLFGMESSVFSILFGLGIILIIPDLINLFKQSLGAKGLGLNIGLGTFFSSVGVAWGATTGGLGFYTSLTQMPFIGPLIKEKVRKAGKLGKELTPPTETELLNKIIALLEKKSP